MLYIGYLIIVNGQNFKKSFSKIYIFDLRVEKCLSSLYAHQMPLNHLKTTDLRVFGGPWLELYGPNGHNVGRHWCSSTRIVTK